jgi:hypothetical protein
VWEHWRYYMTRNITLCTGHSVMVGLKSRSIRSASNVGKKRRQQNFGAEAIVKFPLGA